MVNFPIGVSYFLSRVALSFFTLHQDNTPKVFWKWQDFLFSRIMCYLINAVMLQRGITKNTQTNKQTNKQSFLIWRHAHSWWSRAYGLYLISRSSSSPHLLVPYTHATPISSKKQMKRSGSVPVKLSNSCNQYSPEVWQNSSPTMRQKRHVRPGKD